MCRFCEGAAEELSASFSLDDSLTAERCPNLRRLPCVILTGFLGVRLCSTSSGL